jgi:hypothetical protein
MIQDPYARESTNSVVHVIYVQSYKTQSATDWVVLHQNPYNHKTQHILYAFIGVLKVHVVNCK